jgi:hypothetical protein
LIHKQSDAMIHMALVCGYQSVRRRKSTLIFIGVLSMRTLRYAQLTGMVYDALLNYAQMFVAMFLSEVLVETPVFGGALYVAGQFWVIYGRFYNKKTTGRLPTSIQAKGFVLFIVSVLLNALLVVVYPWVMTRNNSLLLLAMVLLLLIRQMLTERLAACRFEKKSYRILLLAVVQLVCIGLSMLAFSGSGNTDVYIPVLMCLLVTGMLVAAKRVFVAPLEEKDDPQGITPDAMMRVSSYRIYNRMLVNCLIAFNLSITMYICYLRYLPYKGFFSSFIGLLVWIGFVFAVMALFLYTFQRRIRWRYDKPMLFVIGAAVWTMTTVLIYNGILTLSGYQLYAAGALYGFGLSCMLSIIISMGIEMKTVIEIGVGKMEKGAYRRNTMVMIDWSLLLSCLLILCMLTLASFIMDGRIFLIDEVIELPREIQLISFLIPMVCVVAALIYLVIQPLDRQYAQKLKEYRRQHAIGELNSTLEKRLRKVLTASGPKRVGIRLIKLLARPFVPMKILGREHMSGVALPVVFVCNHYEIYGPVAAVVRIPYYFRPWIVQDMLDETIIMDAMKPGVDNVFRLLPQPARAWLCKRVTPLILWIVNSLDPIPVNRGAGREILHTIRLSVETLEFGDNILLFPENPASEESGRYASEGVSEFYTGFSSIGRVYYQRTGKRLPFIPVYIDKAKHTLQFGQQVQYDPDNSRVAEKQRIAKELYERMSELAKRE